ncbi:MAG: hypothetical protein WA071_00765 [Undibacterium umbellatum]|uniref:hypothetical protein n=1 Tax=Undibacterium umbellatum TaxID=2762300 RepID=UPI003BB54F55
MTIAHYSKSIFHLYPVVFKATVLPNENMHSVQELQQGAIMLRTRCLDTVTQFASDNPGIPAQAVAIGLGELLIQFSVSQLGQEHTHHLLSSLQEAVLLFGDKIMEPH